MYEIAKWFLHCEEMFEHFIQTMSVARSGVVMGLMQQNSHLLTPMTS